MVPFRHPLLLITFSVARVFAQSDFSGDVEGYLEPYQQIDVATVETGIIEAIQVQEGATVKAGQVLVRLDNKVLAKSLGIAQQEAQSVGNLKTTRAEHELQKNRLAKLETIFASGHGRATELERARSDVQVALGRVLRAEEEIAIKQKELELIRAKMALREISAPMNGLVTRIHKNPGEAVSPTNPTLLTLVDIGQLKCVMNVPRGNASGISRNQRVMLESDTQQKIVGTVQWKSPLVDAESETVKVIIRIDNSEGRYTSGEHCVLRENAKLAEQPTLPSDKNISYRGPGGKKNGK